MNSTIKNILFMVLAIIIGSIINYGIILLGHNFVPVPEGVNPEDIGSIQANVEKYTAKHFIMPFLAHAIGTLSGAYAISRLAVSNQKRFALIVGAIFCLGGVMMAVALPAFWKFSVIDLLLAYFPMAILGWSLAGKPK
jgi:hypothetical protein